MTAEVEVRAIDGEESFAVADLLAVEDAPVLAAGHDVDDELVERDVSQREVFVRIHKWGDVADTPAGKETFLPGAFAEVDPKDVVLRLGHDGAPVGHGVGDQIEEREDGAYMRLRASKTPRGDEALELGADGTLRHISVEYDPRRSVAQWVTVAGAKVVGISKAALRGVALTYKPFYAQTAVLEVRETPTAREGLKVTETVVETPAAPAIDFSQIDAAIAKLDSGLETRFAALEKRMQERETELNERQRADFVMPGQPATPAKPKITSGMWMQSVLKMLSGERVPELQMRDLADLITSDNIGVVPDAFSTTIIGKINKRRPFMESTTKAETPTSGMSLTMPRIVTRPTVGDQDPEKEQLASTTTEIDAVDFPAVTKGGAGDISLQLLKRSSPSYLSLYLDLLAEALAISEDRGAILNLLTNFGAPGGVNDGGSFDPEDPSLGEAWVAGSTALNDTDAPDTIWLSSAAVGAFIDAQAGTTNLPMYPNFTVSNGAGGTIRGLTAVHCPALNPTAVDVLVGPASGFAWSEDGAFTLQVDVPAKAGRDVALVSIVWYAALYEAAFTGWALAA